MLPSTIPAKMTNLGTAFEHHCCNSEELGEGLNVAYTLRHLRRLANSLSPFRNPQRLSATLGLQLTVAMAQHTHEFCKSRF